MISLNGRRILVTRPREQAAGLMQMLRDAGGEPVLFPALEIRDPADPAALVPLLSDMSRYDLAVFISPTAVERGLRQAALAGSAPPWPASVKVAAVGPGSAAALAAAGIGNVIVPASRFDSEGLLERLSKLNFRNVIVFRGGGGRELLAGALRQRGAEVTLAECYERVRPDCDPVPVVAAWREGRLDALVVTSSEAMDNLADMLGEGGRELLAALPLFAPHPRIVERAQWRGAVKARLTGAGDAGLIEGITGFFAKVVRHQK